MAIVNGNGHLDVGPGVNWPVLGKLAIAMVLALTTATRAALNHPLDCLGEEPICLKHKNDGRRGGGGEGGASLGEETCPKGCGCCYSERRIVVACCGPDIRDIPNDLPTNTSHLSFINTGIVNLMGTNERETERPTSKFCRYKKLKMLFFRYNNQLEAVSQGSLDFRCATPLNHLRIETSPKLTMIERDAIGHFASLQTLKIKDSALREVPEWGDFSFDSLTELSLKNNQIKRIKRNAFRSIKGEIGDLNLVGNEIEEVEDYAFNDMVVKTIELADNRNLRILGDEAFTNTSMLRYLDLSNTSIENLPTKGLNRLKNLTIQNVPTLKIFPPVLRFLSVKQMKLTYPYHCCAFKYPQRQNKTLYQQLKEELLRNCNSLNSTAEEAGYGNRRIARGLRSLLEDIRKHDNGSEELVVQLLGLDTDHDKHHPSLVSLAEDVHNGEVVRIIRRPRSLDDHTGRFGKYGDSTNRTEPDELSPNGGIWYTPDSQAPNMTTAKINCGVVFEGFRHRDCTPLPDALNPCEDVMGYSWLRVTVWMVVTTAILGNFIVLVITVSRRMTVGKFLMCNLAVADLCLGLYLLILAVYDLHTSGVYFAYAIAWQTEGGCQVAGFLSTFSTCLSVFTLSVITLERWYAISHAINLSKRLRMRQAVCIMAFGWVCALTMAALPLLGISSYGKTSLCLPMDTDTMLSAVYVMVLLIINALAFVVIAVCYFDMYRQVTNPGNTTAAGRNDATIAKRMAILVVTDFACFFPIAFFGITAASGVPLITVTRAKILLVFFFPLNSCANPFLYAIFTKQFKKDLFRNLNKCNICTTIAARYRAVYTSAPLSHSQSRASPATATDQSWCGAICSCCICYGSLPDNGNKNFQEINAPYISNSRENHEGLIVDNSSPVNGIRLLHGSAKVCLHLTISTKDFNNSRRGTQNNRQMSLTSPVSENSEIQVADDDDERVDVNEDIWNIGEDPEKADDKIPAVPYNTDASTCDEAPATIGTEAPAGIHSSVDSDLDIDLDMDEIESSSNGLLSDNETKSCSSEATQEDMSSLGPLSTVKSGNLNDETEDKVGEYYVCQDRVEREEENLQCMENSTLLCDEHDGDTICRYNTKC